MPRVSGLFIYPVKSLRGCPVSEMAVDELGPRGDRRFLVVDESGKFLTQRTLPRMARIATALTARRLELSAEGAGMVSVPLAEPGAARRTVSIWRSQGLLAEDCGPEAAGWLSRLLGLPCALVRIGAQFRRAVLERRPYSAAPPEAPIHEGRVISSDLVGFADGYPFLLTSETSLADLNDRLLGRGGEPLPMDRFRPNLVISDVLPYAEESAPGLRVGPIAFRSGGPCARCIMTTTDQLTGERTGPEPLHTLAEYRRDPHDPTRINFGLNLIHETKSGLLHLGDEVMLF